MSYKVEIIEKKDPTVQLETNKSSIKDVFSDPYISTYRHLSGSSYIDLSIELRSPRKGLINIKNKD